MQEKSLSRDLVSLNDRLTLLTAQELDIFLNLKGESTVVRPIYDVTFTELLLHSLDYSSPDAKIAVLNALKYIVSNNKNSRISILSNPKTLERIANSNGVHAELSRDILQIADDQLSVPRKPAYHFDAGQPYQFLLALADIFKRASGSLMIFDNYADHEIFEYIDNYCNCSSLSDIIIVCNDQLPNVKNATKRIAALKQVANKFSQENPQINIEIKSNSNVHDRYVVTDKELWHFGPSLKDGGKKICTINQLKGENEANTRSSLQVTVNNSIVI